MTLVVAVSIAESLLYVAAVFVVVAALDAVRSPQCCAAATLSQYSGLSFRLATLSQSC